MYKILKAEKLAEKIFLMDVEAPRVAKHCEPGQFVIVKMDVCAQESGPFDGTSYFPSRTCVQPAV